MPMMKETMLKRLLLPIAAAGGGGSAPVQDTATGNPMVFFTDLARQLKSLLVPFTPQQSGTGDPSPTNIRPFVPWDGLTVWQGGKNLAKLTYGTKVPSISNGQMVVSNGWSSDFIRIDKTKNYYCSGNASLGNVYTLYYGADHSYLGNRSHNSADSALGFSLDSDSYFSNATYVKLRNDSNSSVVLNIQLEEGSSATDYEAPNITETDIVFPSPVYGGTLDVVSGVLTVEYIAHTFTANDALYRYGEYTGGIRINTNVLDNTKVGGSSAICNIAQKLNSAPATIDSLSYRISGGTSRTAIFIPDSMFDGGATVDKFKEWLSENEFTICAELETPQEIQLTPQQLTALKGNNTIWSDADGSMTATYLKKAL